MMSDGSAGASVVGGMDSSQHDMDEALAFEVDAIVVEGDKKQADDAAGLVPQGDHIFGAADEPRMADDQALPSDTQSQVYQSGIASSSGSQELLMRRMLIPGAISSADDFAARWKRSHEVWEILKPKTIHVAAGEIYTIQHFASKHHKAAKEAMAEQPERIQRLATTALATYTVRACDIGVRERILVLWVACGDILVRAHGDLIYCYNPELGSWEACRGTYTEHVFRYLNNFLLEVEGCFRTALCKGVLLAPQLLL